MKSYIDEINAFNAWLEYNRISTATIAMWYALMHINNNCRWKQWFNCPSVLIERRTSMSRMQIKRARDTLIEHGLIEYEKGANQ